MLEGHGRAKSASDTAGHDNRRPRAAFATLGCKLNQYETQQMRELLERAGYEIVEWDEPADVYVVNSCTVTGRADRETRRLARGAKRRQPDALVVVAGCYADTGAEALREIPEIDLIVPNADKPRLALLLAEAAPGRLPVPESPPADEGPMITYFAGHTRAFVKVQEGCNANCAYCIIPRARGQERSVPVERVIEQVRLLSRAGYRESVLIGTHLGRYGMDLEPRETLAGLCRRLLEMPELGRLRLSSIEPREVSDELIDMLAASAQARMRGEFSGPARLCRHLHIPLQSGCDSVLRRMRRPYDTAFYRELVERLVAQVPGICIGADVMAGFPGETDEEFAQTEAFLRALPIAYLHAFTYSARHGTPAAEMDAQVRPDIRKHRTHILREISEEKRQAFAESQVGQLLDVLIERADDEHIEGTSDNYLRVRATRRRAAPRPASEQRASAESAPCPTGDIVLVEATEAHEGDLTGHVVEALSPPSPGRRN